jgi:hypothetical protein
MQYLFLWSLQTQAFVEYLTEHKTSWSVHPPEDDHFRSAYDWLKISTGLSGYPIWAWYKYNGKQAKPSLKYMESHIEQAPYMLHLCIPRSRVRLHCYDRWHCVLNQSFVPMHDLDKEWDEYESMDQAQQLKYRLESWPRIFKDDPHAEECNAVWGPSSYIQATVGNLYLGDVLKIERLR